MALLYLMVLWYTIYSIFIYSTMVYCILYLVYYYGPSGWYNTYLISIDYTLVRPADEFKV